MELQPLEQEPRRRIPWDGGRAILFYIFTAVTSLLLGALLFLPVGFYGAVLISEILAFGLIPFALSYVFDTGWSDWLGPATIGRAFWPLALLAVASFTVAQSNLPVLIDRFFPIPEGQLLVFEQYLTAESPWQLIGIFIVAAIVPAICEEIAFRGVIQRGLRNTYGARHAVVWTGLLFAVLHLNPWNFIGLWSLGCLLGYVTERVGSIRPAILLHMLNNAFALAVFYVQGRGAWEERPEFIAWYWTVLAGIILILSLYWLHKSTEPERSSDVSDDSADVWIPDHSTGR